MYVYNYKQVHAHVWVGMCLGMHVHGNYLLICMPVHEYSV